MTRNMAASVRQRLLNRAKTTQENYNNLLLRYGIERLLYRISVSAHADEFVLKGASIFYVWTGQFHRPTKDVDMLRHGPTEPELLAQIVLDCVRIPQDDGLRFEEESIKAQTLREEQVYSGVRVTLKAYLGKAQIALQLDVGTGDVVISAPERIEYPSLLDMPCASLRAYRLETLIAEKCQAMMSLGMSNTRLKDFYDIYTLASIHQFDARCLQEALRSTFMQRGTPFPVIPPVAWNKKFYQDAQKTAQWQAFLRKSKLDATPLEKIVQAIEAFLMPLLQALDAQNLMDAQWRDGAWHIDEP